MTLARAALLLALVVLACVIYMVAASRVSAPTPPSSIETEPGEKTTADFPASYEIRDTDGGRVQGLSGRADVPSDYGMLFVFTDAGSYGFWMKDMFVPIDIVWLLDDGTIAGITASVSPDTFPAAFTPPVPVRLVLEVRAGEAARKGWEVGTKLTLPPEANK